MSDSGLTNRLRQRSRRAGLAVGLSMALTIAVCIGSFAWIYAKADPFLSDFVGAEATTPTNATRTPTSEPRSTGAGGSAPDEAEPTATEGPVEAPTQRPTPSPTSSAFKATHISNPDLQVNLRPEPSVNNEPVAVLALRTPLQALGDQQTDSDGNLWLQFRTEDGQEGWLREGTYQAI